MSARAAIARLAAPRAGGALAVPSARARSLLAALDDGARALLGPAAAATAPDLPDADVGLLLDPLRPTVWQPAARPRATAAGAGAAASAHTRGRADVRVTDPAAGFIGMQDVARARRRADDAEDGAAEPPNAPGSRRVGFHAAHTPAATVAPLMNRLLASLAAPAVADGAATRRHERAGHPPLEAGGAEAPRWDGRDQRAPARRAVRAPEGARADSTTRPRPALGGAMSRPAADRAARSDWEGAAAQVDAASAGVRRRLESWAAQGYRGWAYPTTPEFWRSVEDAVNGGRDGDGNRGFQALAVPPMAVRRSPGATEPTDSGRPAIATRLPAPGASLPVEAEVPLAATAWPPARDRRHARAAGDDGATPARRHDWTGASNADPAATADGGVPPGDPTPAPTPTAAAAAADRDRAAVTWFEDEELAERLGRILSRQARRRGIELP